MASTPGRLIQRTKRVLGKLWDIWQGSSVRLLPAHVAFFAVLSAIPLLIIFYFIAQTLSIDLQGILTPLQSVLPPAVSDVLSPTEAQASGLSIGVWIVIAFVLGSNGTYSVIVGSNSLYGFEPQNYFWRRFKAVVLTLILVILALIGISLVGFGEYLAGFLPTGLKGLVGFIKWLLVGVLVFGALKYLYMVTPERWIPSRYTTKGSLVTLLGWLVATIGYSYYSANLSSYAAVYGSLAGMIVLMIWVYILSTIFVVGLIVNVYEYQKGEQRKQEAGEVSTLKGQELRTSANGTDPSRNKPQS